MKAQELTGLAVEELQAKAMDLSEELFNLRFQLHTGHLENTARIPQVKKEIARVKTVLRQKLG